MNACFVQATPDIRMSETPAQSGALIRSPMHKMAAGRIPTLVSIEDRFTRPGTCSSRAEASNEPALPGRFDGPGMVVLPDVAHGITGGDSIKNGQTRQFGDGPALSTATCHLDPLDFSPSP